LLLDAPTRQHITTFSRSSKKWTVHNIIPMENCQIQNQPSQTQSTVCSACVLLTQMSSKTIQKKE
jgi:hypothetical protein